MAKVVKGNRNILTEDQEQMRLQVVDLELKARYWEAQWKIRFYTLEAEGLQKSYDEFLEVEKAKREEALVRFQEQIDKMNKEAGNIPTPSPVETEKEFFAVPDEEEPYETLLEMRENLKPV